jgi:fumarate reductase subunit C
MSRELSRPLPRTWWLTRAPYLRFMIRELTSLAVFAYALFLVWAMWSARDTRSFSSLFEYMQSPRSVWWHLVVLVLALFHTGTWIALTPTVLVVWRDDDRVDPDFIAGMMGVVFVAVSGAVLWLTLG